MRAVSRGIEVDRPSREANILRLAYQSTDPVLARDVPNVLADRFVALRQEMHTTEARSTARFLREQLDTLSRQLASSEQTLQRFQQASSVVDLETEGRTELTQAAQFQAERSTMATEHDALAALVRSADAEAAAQTPGQPSPYRRLAAFPSLMRTQTTSELLSSLTRLENERGALMVRRRPNDPEVEALTTRIRQIEGELRQLADTYRGALAGQIASLDGHLSASRGRLDRIPARALQNARLSRQPQVLSEIYAVLQARLKEAEIAVAGRGSQRAHHRPRHPAVRPRLAEEEADPGRRADAFARWSPSASATCASSRTTPCTPPATWSWPWARPSSPWSRD